MQTPEDYKCTTNKLRIKIYYKKNLRLSEGKVAAQCGHVAKELGRMLSSDARTDTIIVLGVSDKKYKELSLQYQKEDIFWYQQIDNGVTEVIKGTPTAFGYIEYE